MKTVINDDGEGIAPIVVGLAELIVEDIFTASKAARAVRIKLMAASENNTGELDLGGFNQDALVDFVAKSIDKNFRGPPFLAAKS